MVRACRRDRHQLFPTKEPRAEPEDSGTSGKEVILGLDPRFSGQDLPP
ncbi:phosphate acetyltransferase [Pseudooceanicola batsensis HTCC2597]|uniref:Phosphate acetyltransferase n=1 Tax=Pseudooceanicola batsensis (strain ATCC BAA-863 / DSM 15984 / KCTC 12145 / HTCC2597) TaxID=252305 RepID=A3TTA5_PSEBH|nr:phosphate acetyltransferase [Pseudooceanicola batsensis HTCC2597]